MTCHIAKTSIFPAEHEHTRVSYVRVCTGSCDLNICRWVQNGPVSGGVYNLGRNISSERNPALGRQVDCMTSSLLSLRAPSSALWSFLGGWWGATGATRRTLFWSRQHSFIFLPRDKSSGAIGMVRLFLRENKQLSKKEHVRGRLITQRQAYWCSHFPPGLPGWL